MRRWIRGPGLGVCGLVGLWCPGGLAMAAWPAGVDHDGLIHSPEAADLAGAWIRDL